MGFWGFGGVQAIKSTRTAVIDSFGYRIFVGNPLGAGGASICNSATGNTTGVVGGAAVTGRAGRSNNSGRLQSSQLQHLQQVNRYRGNGESVCGLIASVQKNEITQ